MPSCITYCISLRIISRFYDNIRKIFLVINIAVTNYRLGDYNRDYDLPNQFFIVPKHSAVWYNICSIIIVLYVFILRMKSGGVQNYLQIKPVAYISFFFFVMLGGEIDKCTMLDIYKCYLFYIIISQYILSVIGRHHINNLMNLDK